MQGKRTPDEPTGFLREPPGTVAVVFEDGSGIVRGDGSERERDALYVLLREQGTDETATREIAETFLKQGMTIVPHVDPELARDARVWGGDMMLALAEQLHGGN